jgi:hypothetical protein
MPKKKIKEEVDELGQEIAKLEAELAGKEGAVFEDMRRQLAILREHHLKAQELGEETEKIIRFLKSHTAADKPSYQAMTTEMMKWRTTVLLTLNSAAAVAIVASDKIAKPTSAAAAVFFLGGILSAYMSGATMDNTGTLGLRLSTEVELFESGVAEEMQEKLKEMKSDLRKVEFMYRTLEVLRLVSVACFCFGVIIAAFRLAPFPI